MLLLSLAWATDVVPGISVRVRPEARTAPRFRPDEGVYTVLQNLNASLHVEKGLVQAHLELQDVRAWGTRNSSLSTEAGTYVHQGWFQVGDEHRWVRVGRQEIRFQKGLFVGEAPFNIAKRSFDAIRASTHSDRLAAEAFLALLHAPLAATEVREASMGEVLGGASLGWTATPGVQTSLLLFWNAAGPTDADPTFAQQWLAPGLRLHAEVGQAELDAQGVVTSGTVKDTPLRSTQLIARYDQHFNARFEPGFSLMLDLSSGHGCEDEACAPDVLRDPVLLFGRNHYLRGLSDQSGGSNLRDFGVEVSMAPSATIDLLAQAHWLQLSNPKGSWRAPTGALLGRDVTNDSHDLGAEFDFRATLTPLKGLTVQGLYAVVIPLAAGRQLGGDTPHQVFFLETALKL